MIGKSQAGLGKSVHSSSGVALIELSIFIIFLALICLLVDWCLSQLGFIVPRRVWVFVWGSIVLWAVISWLADVIKSNKRTRRFQRLVKSCEAAAKELQDGEGLRDSAVTEPSSHLLNPIDSKNSQRAALPQAQSEFVAACKAYFGETADTVDLSPQAQDLAKGSYLELTRQSSEWVLSLHRDADADRKGLAIVRGKVPLTKSQDVKA